MKGVLFAILLLPLIAQGQKIDYDKTDPFDSSRMVATKEVRLHYDPTLVFFAGAITINSNGKFDTSYVLYFNIWITNVNSIDGHNNVVVRFNDGKVIQRPHSGGYKIYTGSEFLSAIIRLDDELEEQINKSPIEKIRVETSNGNYDIDVKEKQNTIVAESIKAVKAKITR